MNSNSFHSASFRDPDGWLFVRDGVLYRQVNHSYQEHYEHLMQSGLYEELEKDKQLVPHKEVNDILPLTGDAFKIIWPEPVPFISYPYEWSFSQLKDAALTTLAVQKKALNYDMSLKDASVYNIQFWKGTPVFIDTLSFEKYREGSPWTAYRQFCQHFLAPLALMSYKDTRISQVLRVFLDGFPLDLASSLLPWKTRFKFPLLTHIHLHARSQKHFQKQSLKVNRRTMSRMAFTGLVDSLQSAITSLTGKHEKTTWSNYYNSSCEDSYLEQKKHVVAEFLDQIKPATVWDLGANTGVFSRIASSREIETVAMDMDPVCVELNYRDVVKNKETFILPLVTDLTNPSPGTGWQNQERMSLMERGPCDTLLALALVHHLAISNNLPFSRIANFLRELGRTLIIEFVPKDDPRVQELLSGREDIFADYNREHFEAAFEKHFSIKKRVETGDSGRVIYLMEKK